MATLGLAVIKTFLSFKLLAAEEKADPAVIISLYYTVIL
jgi:hypothetical protein